MGTAYAVHIWRLCPSDLVGHETGETHVYERHCEGEEGRGHETRGAEVEYDNLVLSILHEVGGVKVAGAKVQMRRSFIAGVDAMGFTREGKNLSTESAEHKGKNSKLTPFT